MKNKRKILSYIIVTLSLFINMFVINFSFAADGPTVKSVGLDNTALIEVFPSGDLTTVFGKAIKIFIGLSATIMLIMVLWAGFDIMFSGGNAEKRKLAINRVVWTAVGIIVITSAYALSSFIINQLRVLTKA